MRQAQRCDNHKWVGNTANETENQFTDSLSTSTKQRGVFARGPSSLISSRKRLQVVKGGFSLPKRRLTGSSSLVGTLERTMFAFDLCTATLMRWKSWSFSAARSRRLLSAHRSASTVKNEVTLVPNPPLVSKASGINSNPLYWQSSTEAANFRSSANLHAYPTSSAALLMRVDCSRQVSVTSTAAGDSRAQIGIKMSPGRLRLDSDRPLASRTGDKPADLQAWKTRSLLSLCRDVRSLAEEQIRAWSPKVSVRDVLQAMYVRVWSKICTRSCRHSVMRNSEFVNFIPRFFDGFAKR